MKKYCQKHPLKEKAYLKVGEHDLHSIKELKDFEVLFISLLFSILKGFVINFATFEHIYLRLIVLWISVTVSLL